MNIGYKARSLSRIKDKGLPCLQYDILTNVSLEQIKKYQENFNGNWAVRTDLPINNGKILPLFGSNRGDVPEDAVQKINKLHEESSDYTFILSESPNDKTREANVVCQMDDGGDILFGEIGYEPMTLRDAWTRGRIHAFIIDNSVGDYLRNRKSYLTNRRIAYLRDIRRLLLGEYMMYEISIMETGRIIFWQEIERCELNSSNFLL